MSKKHYKAQDYGKGMTRAERKARAREEAAAVAGARRSVSADKSRESRLRREVREARALLLAGDSRAARRARSRLAIRWGLEQHEAIKMVGA